MGWDGHFHIQPNYSVEVVLCCCWGCDNIYMYYLLQIYNFHIYILHSLCYYKYSDILKKMSSRWLLIKRNSIRYGLVSFDSISGQMLHIQFAHDL